MTDTTKNRPEPDVVGASGGELSGAAVAEDLTGVDATTGGPVTGTKPRSLWSDAWFDLRRNPLFWISGVLILIFIAMAVAPGLFTSKDPSSCDLASARHIPSNVHWFGTDIQGCDVYARTIYGARSSILVGLLATTATTVVGSIIGLIAG